MKTLRAWLVILAAGWACVALAQAPYVNWENHPVHALDLSPDGRTLAIAHTADERVQFFDVSTGRAVFAGSVVVGLDPVSVRFRSAAELWVVNHISDSLSVVDVTARRVVSTLTTLDEPFDVVFAGSPQRAFVTASQANTVQVFDPANRAAAPVNLHLPVEDPRAMAVSPDGQTVYVAVFESGNGTTILAGGTDIGDYPPNVTRESGTPYNGVNPPPNSGNGFSPALNPDLPTAPSVGQIVRRDAGGRWMDDNGGDWSAFVTGANAARSGRVPGWDLPDRDLAIIDANTLQVSWASRLMNIGMALAVNPNTGAVLMVGTDATNEVRFEPNVNGTFVRVLGALVPAAGGSPALADLNPHLDYSTPMVTQSLRDQSLGDPRSAIWLGDGSAGFVAGMGSNNVVRIDGQGRRHDGAPAIEVGQGPVGLALSADENRLFVWNHFDASLSVIDVASGMEQQRLATFSPVPESIRAGRPHFYDTHRTSGLGQASCASCHVDARTDRLAWDLGDPGGEIKGFNQNCSSSRVAPCRPFHPLKGPMTTQTLQDIIGHEPLHWRGDRDGLEEFNPAFQTLMGDDAQLSPGQMQQFENFLATVTPPPNPFRTFTNGLSANVNLAGHFTTGRFGPAGQPLGTGNAISGSNLFTNDPDIALLPLFNNVSITCAGCHTLPTGMGSDGMLIDPRDGTRIGGTTQAIGPNGENHLHVQGAGTVTAATFKVAQLRTLYEKTGFDMADPQSRSGFGFLHDGSVDTLAEFVSLDEFGPESDQEVADLVAFLLSFGGVNAPANNPGHQGNSPTGLATHAAVGTQVTAVSSSFPALVSQMTDLADGGRVDLVVHGASGGWHYSGGTFQDDAGGAPVGLATLQAQASATNPLTFTVVPAGLGQRLALDRDGDGQFNAVEINQGSNPADPASSALTPAQGLWYNPGRQGHGIDLQRAGELLAATWYTYNDDGSPTWYQAVGTFAGSSWTADLLSYTLPAPGQPDGTVVGSMTFDFSDASQATFTWTLGERSGSEPFERFAFSNARTLRQNTGLWFDPAEPGYGLSIDTLGEVRVVVAYFYDADNQPRWAIGQSANDAAGTMDMLSVNGFCPDCAFVPTRTQAGGSVTLEFDEPNRQVQMTLAVDYPGREDSAFGRTAQLAPLTDVPVNLEQ